MIYPFCKIVLKVFLIVYHYEEYPMASNNKIPVIVGSGKDEVLSIPGKDDDEIIPTDAFDNGTLL